MRLSDIPAPKVPPEKEEFYREYIAGEKWASARACRMVYDGLVCAVCGSDNLLEVHHLTYDRLGHEHGDDLVTLCHDCHMKVHGWDGKEISMNDYGIKPCPFCGGEAELIDEGGYVKIKCKRCRAQSSNFKRTHPVFDDCATEGLVTRWNRLTRAGRCGDAVR